ncbi:MAG: glycosyltransferase [Deltaproteobacteria bacterium]|jgi:tetratricopeptide (TPR) repeat protein|nr:glycosyltransferase [Deltaproteobacteria bacterium]
MLILCLGSEYFYHSFHKLGHSVLIPPHEEGLPIDTLFNGLQDRPDLIVYTDHLGQHHFPEGLSNIYGIPKIYYAVDTPINFWWQKHFAHLFDYTFVDQKPFVAKLNGAGLASSWLPVAVNVPSYQPEKLDLSNQSYDFGFVGSTDLNTRPKRNRLLKTLSNRYSLKTGGSRQEGWLTPEDSGQIYRQSRLALNECLFPGVTTRMMEAMASGAVLFTEKAGGDLGELFVPGEDFAWFEPEELIESAEFWLGDAKRRKKTAKRALDKMAAAHDIDHRAETLFNVIKRLHCGRALVDVEAWNHEGQAMYLTALRWPRESGQVRIVRAEKLFEKALDANVISPTSLYMLGQIKRHRKEGDLAERYLVRAYEEGEARGALGLGLLKLCEGDLDSSQDWFVRFTQNPELGPMEKNTLPFDHVKSVARRLIELGHDLSPGFSRVIHDPAEWNALEFYQAAYSSRPGDLEIAQELAGLLLNHGASAEALDVAQKAMESHPNDPVLGGIYAQAGRASYLTIN